MSRVDALFAGLEAARQTERDLISGDLMPEDGGEVPEAIDAARDAVESFVNLLDYLGV